jgi:tetrahydromethanopterin S-methyltransferase subunit G
MVLHVGAHLVSQSIAAAITKDSDDRGKLWGVVVALIVGLVLNLLISSL